MRNRVSRVTHNFRRLVGVIGRVLGLFVAVWGGGGCGPSQPEVVVYCALDAEFAQPIFDQFEQQTGIRVLAKFDVESTKTVGLANALIAESERPRADVFWNNEIIHTARLARLGLLAPYEPARAGEYPAEFRAANHTWHGFAARARVLLVNTQLVSEKDRPRGLDDLTLAKWRGKIGIAKPLFGTTATHAACLFATWGEARTQKFFRQLKQNDVQILAGNKAVAQAVSAGRIAIGLTDTDDAMVEDEAGHRVVIVYPDSPTGQETLFIPNTLAVIRDAPHRKAAEQLVDYLLTPEVEQKLADGPSAQIPLHPAAILSARVAIPTTIKPLTSRNPGPVVNRDDPRDICHEAVRPMTVDFQLAGELWESTAKFIRDEFTGER